VPVDPTDSILAVEALVVPILAAVDGVENALANEPGPDKLPKLGKDKATASLLWTSGDPRDAETSSGSSGAGQDSTYSWRVNLYVYLHGWEAAQDELKLLQPKVLAAFRSNYRVVIDPDREPAWLAIRDSGEPPTFNVKQGYLRKALVLTATVNEA
jgi:hypothetical protein